VVGFALGFGTLVVGAGAVLVEAGVGSVVGAVGGVGVDPGIGTKAPDAYGAGVRPKAGLGTKGGSTVGGCGRVQAYGEGVLALGSGRDQA